MVKKQGSLRFQLGAFQLIVISDGGFPVTKEFFFADTPSEIIEHFPTKFEAPLNFMLIDTGEKRLLVDTGLGEEKLPTSGQLRTQLQEEGFSPDDIDMVILTHGHLDHIGGVSQQGVPVFPSADYVIREEEWNYWMNRPSSEEFKKLKALKDVIRIISKDMEIHQGIRLQHAPGHTDGHLVVTIESEGERLLIASDILNDPSTLQHLPSHIGAEVSKEQGFKTRVGFLEESYRLNTLLFVCHYPFPGLGYVEKGEQGFRWIPADIESNLEYKS